MPGTPTRERGELEQAVLRLLRAHGAPISARDLQGQFTDPVPAYTTIMTVLSRLESKGDVVRSGDSPRKVRFAPAETEEESASRSMRNALDSAGDRRAALLAFAGNLDPEDVALLNAAFGDQRPGR